MNRHVYRILQLTILLIIAFFIYMIVQAVKDINCTHDVVDVVMCSVSIVCFSCLLFIMERDRRRDNSR